LAIDGKKPLFDCKNIRLGCAVFGATPPRWAGKGICSIHAVMLEAESRMRAALASHSLADLAARVGAKAPPGFANEISNWLGERSMSRRGAAQSRTRAR
jgi:DNA-binding IscR family transcriptional regulator